MKTPAEIALNILADHVEQGNVDIPKETYNRFLGAIRQERQRADALAEALRTAVYYAIVEDTSLHMAQAVMMGAPLPDNIAWPSWVVSGRAALAAYDAEAK